MRISDSDPDSGFQNRFKPGFQISKPIKPGFQIPNPVLTRISDFKSGFNPGLIHRFKIRILDFKSGFWISNPDFGFKIRILDLKSGFWISNPDFGFQIRVKTGF
jgi:hypothetical protein